jgi:hypothetical protein
MRPTGTFVPLRHAIVALALGAWVGCATPGGDGGGGNGDTTGAGGSGSTAGTGGASGSNGAGQGGGAGSAAGGAGGSSATTGAGGGTGGTSATTGAGGARPDAGTDTRPGNGGAGGSAAGGAGGSAAGGAGGSAAGGAGGSAAGGAGGGLLPGEPNCTWPTGSGSTTLNSTMNISGSMDLGMKRYIAGSSLGDGSQSEGQKPLFMLADGATLSNVVIGNPGADGIHCSGSCTLKNVWWDDVGEDAFTELGSSSSTTILIDGGGAQHASDKIMQLNGGGTITIQNFCAYGFGKLARSCGNCSKQYTRHIVLKNISATLPGNEIVGVNSNYNDTATLTNIIIHGRQTTPIVVCSIFTGNTSGAEPTMTGMGPDGKNCIFNTATDIHMVP